MNACGDLPRFNSMKLKGVAQSAYNPEDTIEYDCRLGYKLKRPPLPTSAVCQSDNKWTPLQEACTRKLCPHPGEPTNGEVKYVNGALEFGSQIHYVCNEGIPMKLIPFCFLCDKLYLKPKNSWFFYGD
ncbi:hypothetical protein HPG69_005565 [Diceros bicornis minor]|uniref:Sushi domain-containing protein n=1 Tax=Diceros bicornis minor TaxID=77932 RepID=A0A7J7ELU5_DICBM|nr:hypothetical protein HPG69_005565 [Diceros bicornis minor]